MAVIDIKQRGAKPLKEYMTQFYAMSEWVKRQDSLLVHMAIVCCLYSQQVHQVLIEPNHGQNDDTWKYYRRVDLFAWRNH